MRHFLQLPLDILTLTFMLIKNDNAKFDVFRTTVHRNIFP